MKRGITRVKTSTSSKSFVSKKKIKMKDAKETKSDDFIGVTDYLEKNMDLVFVGFNPGIRSGLLGHHYAGKNNHFYDLLFESGIVSRRFTFQEDGDLLEYGIGFTNICSRTTSSSADLQTAELKSGAVELLDKLKLFQPKIVCFNGMGVYEYTTKTKATVGEQAKIPGLSSRIFVVPSPSARVLHYSKDFKLEKMKELKLILDQVRQENQTNTNP